MAAAIRLRGDYDGPALRVLARKTKDAAQSRRLLALAEVYDGGSRSDAARIGGAQLQTVRDWVLRFNDRGPDGLIDGKAKGQTPKLNAEQLRGLEEIVERGPIPAIHGVVRWRVKDLVQWVFEEYRISVSETTISRALKKMNFRRLSARPKHRGQKEGEIEAFKKTSPPCWRRSAKTIRKPER